MHPKTLKKCGFFKVFKNAAFWLFEAADASLGLILPPLWPNCDQNGPQNASQKCSKKKTIIILFFCFFIFSIPKYTVKKNKKSAVLKHNLDQPFCTNSKTDLQKKQNEPKKQSLSLKRQKK